MPPATGSRSCSACRCASRSTRKSWRRIRCRSGLSMQVEVDTHERGGDRLPQLAQSAPAVRDRRVSARSTMLCGSARVKAIIAANEAGAATAARGQSSAAIVVSAALAQQLSRPQPLKRCAPLVAHVAPRRRDQDRVLIMADTASARSTRRTRPPLMAAARSCSATIALVARDVHERARHVDRQRVDPGDLGRSRRVARSRYLGHHVLLASPTRSRCRSTGWLTQRYGQVRLFTRVDRCCSSSHRCCAAWRHRIEALIVFRVIQGAVAGPMIPLSQSLLLSSYPKEKSGTCARHVGDHDARRAGRRPAARRMDHRQHLRGRGFSTSTCRSGIGAAVAVPG